MVMSDAAMLWQVCPNKAYFRRINSNSSIFNYSQFKSIKFTTQNTFHYMKNKRMST